MIKDDSYQAGYMDGLAAAARHAQVWLYDRLQTQAGKDLASEIKALKPKKVKP